MADNLHVCYEGGIVDLGWSDLAEGVLSREHDLPGPWERELIAQALLREAADDDILKELWAHAGQIAMMRSYPDTLADSVQATQPPRHGPEP